MMNKLTALFLTAAMSLSTGAAMAADTPSGGNNNGQANQSADAGAKAGGAHENLAPNGVNNSNINENSTGSGMNSGTGTTGTGSGTMLHPNNGDTSADGSGMSKDDVHKNSMCKDGRCPDMNKKVQTQTGGGDVDQKTDGTSQ